MLAQNFKTSGDLHISDLEFESLIKVLKMLETGKIPSHLFTMELPGDSLKWNEEDCGSPACICGWARYIARSRIFGGGMEGRETGLCDLFIMGGASAETLDVYPSPFRANISQAACAVRNYLTFGEPRWAEVMAEG